MFKNLSKTKWAQNRFYRNVMTLMSGTAVAQVLPVVTLPVLSRLYTPEQFGTFGLFLSIATSLSVLSTGRYEIAVMLPKRDDEAFHLVVLSSSIALCFSAAFLALTFFIHGPLSVLLKNPEISRWLFLASFSILFLGLFQIFNYWANRNNRYRDMAVGRVIQTGLMVAVALGLGFFHAGSGGLICAAVVGQLAAAAYLAAKSGMKGKNGMPAVDRHELVRQAARYSKFPRINSMHALMDMLQLNGIVFLISAFFGKTVLGYYSMTMRVLRTPLSFVGTSIAQVFYQRTSSDYNAGREFYGLVKKTAIRLALLAFPAFLVLFLAAPAIFSFVLGPKWREAGVYAKILAPWLYLNFIYSPMSQIPLILNKQGTNFLIGLGYNLLILAFVFVGYRSGNIKMGFSLISVFVTLYLMGILFWLFRISKTALSEKRD